MTITEVLLIGGRSGVGKSTVGYEVSARLRAADIGHALIEGDVLDHLHPAPPGDPHRTLLTEHNLAAIWATYAALGCRRLIYTNTAAVLASESGLFARALGADLRVVRVLLTASDATARDRLAGRELGSEHAQQVRRSAFMARRLEEQAAAGTVRVATDGRGVMEIAAEVAGVAGWAERR
ncbi:AAA family ATPase [Streptomyces sp. 184]|uniref:AAA family ATPase n=1 Tax=Streptomyces sp. 184 TaxID=1827526 RepID=UPI003891E426